MRGERADRRATGHPCRLGRTRCADPDRKWPLCRDAGRGDHRPAGGGCANGPGAGANGTRPRGRP
ncbi:hypothetical protein BRX36_03315 [Sphingomonas sp. S-NIH.Pt1_0416]|nr:hypothetical protein BRX36_03315 [Sphingomonas sp. S-NIH.Pt1_0416]